MTTKHTPGPWTVDIDTNDLREAETIRGPDNVRIAATYKIHEHRQDKTKAYYEARANSRLIAAAPDLLDALLSIAEHAREFADLEDSETMVVRMTDKARAAIAKATGSEA